MLERWYAAFVASRSASGQTAYRMSEAIRPVVDQLESRAMLSTVTPTVADITYKGSTIQVVKDSYVALVKNDASFMKLAAKAGFTSVTSLGGSGFYSFVSSWTASKVDKWAASNKKAVASAAPNMLRKPTATSTDPYYQYQWAFNNTGAITPAYEVVSDAALAASGDTRQQGTDGADIDLERAWNITTGSSDVVIAVIDSGIDVYHPELRPNLWTNSGEVDGDGVDNDGNGYIDDIYGYNMYGNTADLTDTIGHGTAVASVISASSNNGIGIAGVSWGAKIMTLKVDVPVLGNYDSAAIISSYNYVVDQKLRGVNVAAANLSFGGLDQIFNNVEFAAIQKLTNAGVVVVASAGNDASNNDNILYGPQRYTALGNRVLTVAATDSQDNLASFSNFGAQTVDVGAPGVQILMAASDDAVGSMAHNTLLDTETGLDGREHGYVSADGTSFSSPIVAGIVALAKSAYPQATAEQIVEAIKDGVDVLPSLSGLNGAGPKYVATGGRVNAYNTLRLLQNRLAGTNSVTQGNWRGAYGSTASFVYGGTTGTPTLGSFNTSTLTPTNSSVVSYSRVKANDARPSQLPTGDGRSEFYLTSGDTIRYDLDFSTTTRRLTLYAADISTGRRNTQTLQLVDTDTGRVLQTVAMNDFRQGQYVSFDVTGRVTLNVIPASGRDAIVNALYVDTTPTTQPVSTDKLTQGKWIGTYGDQGYVLPGLTSSLVSGVQVSSSAGIVVGRSASKTLAPESPASSKTRSAGLLTSSSPFTITTTLASSVAREVSFYAYNSGKTARIQRVEQLDSSNNVVSYIDVSLPKGTGQYVTFRIDETTTFRVSSLGGGDASVAGVFVSSVLGTGTSASLVSIDTKTGGKYRGLYGTSGLYVVGASSTLPDTLAGNTLPTTGVSTTIVAVNSRSTAALQNPNTLSGGIVGYLTAPMSVTIPLKGQSVNASADAGDSPTALTRVSAYFVDFDKKKRVQQVEIIDVDTGAVLSTVTLREFSKGVYLTWDVSGNVAMKVTQLNGSGAVVSGIFTD